MERKTSQREAIKEVLEAHDRPMSPQEILEAAREKVPTIGIATVYRTVKGLLEEGWLELVQIPTGPSRYEVAGKAPHNHFYCRVCDKVYEVESELIDMEKVSLPEFQLEGHNVLLYGKCSECDDSGEPETQH